MRRETGILDGPGPGTHSTELNGTDGAGGLGVTHNFWRASRRCKQWHQRKQSNETRKSRTDPDAKLYCKGKTASELRCKVIP